MSLLAELRRRNVIRMAGLYLVGAWLVVQVAGTLLPVFEAPAWAMKMLVGVLAIAFVPALVFAWVFELTPEGLRRDGEGQAPAPGASAQATQRINRVILVLMALALLYFATDKFLLAPARSAAMTAAAPSAKATVEPAPAAAAKSVAVLPFVAMSPSAQDGYFADGLSEEIINALTTLPDLLVTARTSTFHFKGKDVPIPEIAKALGVTHVVEGSVRRAGDNLRVTAQLIRASDGFNLWSQSYDRPVTDMFAVQQDIAANVARALDVVLDGARRERMLAGGTQNVEAFLAYRKALDMLDDWHADDRRSGKLWDALAQLDEATRLDPRYFVAQMDSADPYTHYLMGHIPPPPGGLDAAAALSKLRGHYDLAYEAARDPDSRLWVDLERQIFADRWDRTPGLIAQFRARIAAGKQFSLVWLSDLMFVTGHADDYLAMAEAGASSNPLDREQIGKAALAALVVSDFQRAEQMITQGLARVGPTGMIRLADIMLALDRGRLDHAMALCEALDANSTNLFLTPVVQAALGDREAALRSLAALEAAKERTVLLIPAYHQLGDVETANRIAAQVDARPLGSLELLDLVATLGNRLPFDLAATPNFARRLAEAGARPGPLPRFSRKGEAPTR